MLSQATEVSSKRPKTLFKCGLLKAETEQDHVVKQAQCSAVIQKTIIQSYKDA
jgi:hypothetical protein